MAIHVDKHHVVCPDQSIDFCTLGMFIIDEIHYQPPKEPVFNILGGAGTYAVLGARLFSPGQQSKTISWIVDRGSDFPESLDDIIRQWNTSAFIRTDTSRLTTRGWNSFDAAETRAFKYTTPKLRLDADSIALSPALLSSKSFHLICGPDRCISLVKSIRDKRREVDPGLLRPIFVWEPVPDLCHPGELLNLTKALPWVDICSPNAVELGNLLGYHHEEVESPDGVVNPDFVEGAVTQLLESMPLSSYAIVVRCGKNGMFVGKNGGRSARACFEADGVAEARIARRKERERRRNDRTGARKIMLAKRGGKTLTDNTNAAPTPKISTKGMHGGLTQDTDMFALFAHLEEQVHDDEEDDDKHKTRSPEAPMSPMSPKSPMELDDLSEDKKMDDEDEAATNDDKDYGTHLWYPAYHLAAERVEDTTGGGNAFLGGLAVGLTRGKGLEASCRWGSVAASFAIEQVGMPILTSSEHDDVERWNGENVQQRLEDFEARVGVGL